MRVRVLLVVGVVVAVALSGCARKYQAERDGKDVGEALCDVRDAEDDAAAQQALADLRDEVDDLSADVTVFTAEDRADIDENVEDLAEHVLQGNEVLAQQDMTVIVRSLDNIGDDLSDAGDAAVDGVLQGLDDCVDG